MTTVGGCRATGELVHRVGVAYNDGTFTCQDCGGTFDRSANAEVVELAKDATLNASIERATAMLESERTYVAQLENAHEAAQARVQGDPTDHGAEVLADGLAKELDRRRKTVDELEDHLIELNRALEEVQA